MKTAFVVDGFNLYHSLVEASKSLGYPAESGTKWLNLWALCDSYMSAIGGGATLVSVHYFSAFAHHVEVTKPGAVARHKHYVECLKATGVAVEMGWFSKKPTKCRHCNKNLRLREEKETDVAIGTRVLELLHSRTAERVVIVTGDTDVAPALRAAQRMFPSAGVCFAFPWNRKNDALEHAAAPIECIKMTRDAYVRHQFPDPLTVGGKRFAKPPSW